MRARTSLLFLAVFALLAISTPLCQADGQVQVQGQGQGQPQAPAAPPSKFSLSAMINARPQLSRTEVDPAAVGAIAPQLEPSPAPMPQTQGGGGMSIDGARLAAFAAQARMAALQAQASAEDDTPGAFMKEYNVDWSHWVALVADRWFYVLRNAEYQIGVQFVTARPALIQFTCYADGTIGNIILKQSSGVPAYDRLQVAALLQAVPTPNFPPGTHRRSITLVQGWESHPKQAGEQDFQPGSFGRDFPLERVRKWVAGQ